MCLSLLISQRKNSREEFIRLDESKPNLAFLFVIKGILGEIPLSQFLLIRQTSACYASKIESAEPLFACPQV